MKNNFSSKLFEKKMGSKQQSNVFGSSFATSGGTESSATSGNDTFITYYDDNCSVSYQSIVFC